MDGACKKHEGIHADIAADISETQIPKDGLTQLGIRDHDIGKNEHAKLQVSVDHFINLDHGIEKSSEILDDQALLEAPRKVKKGKKKSSGKTKAPKPTGFEEYYVETPRTTEEFEEEQHLYSQSKTFEERMLLAISRYASRRKFDSFRLNIFDKYMWYQCVNTGPKMFQGGVDENGPAMDSSDIAIQKSKYSLRKIVFDEGDVSVDFHKVAKGFLSSYLLSFQEMHLPEEFKGCTNVVRNFLNYLLHHDVCPEYADQIFDAKTACDQAEEQLPVCAKLSRELPGTFNQACSMLFGGFHQNTYIEDPEHANSLGLDPGMRLDEANKVFLTGLAAYGSSEMVGHYNGQAKSGKITIKHKKEEYLEVIEVEHPTREVLELYNLDLARGLKPVGRVKLSYWRHPAGPFPQMTPQEVAIYKKAPYDRPMYKMLLDINLLPMMMPGTKILCTHRETSFGLCYFDNILAVLSPMYTWLHNESWANWVTPQAIPYKSKSDKEDYFDGVFDDSVLTEEERVIAATKIADFKEILDMMVNGPSEDSEASDSSEIYMFKEPYDDGGWKIIDGRDQKKK